MFKIILTLLFLALPAQATLKVMVIDTGLDLKDPRFQNILCKQEHRDVTNTGMVDRHGHGTHVLGLIKEYAKDSDYCVIIVKFVDTQNESMALMVANYLDAIRYVDEIKPDIVNISGGGSVRLITEELVIFNNSKTKFIVAAGNSNQDINTYCPACHYGVYPNVEPVGALDGVAKAKFSNYGTGISWEQGVNILSTLPDGKIGRMSGSSQACAVHTGKAIRAITSR